jgi:amino-acid N-acetyltransferase
VPPAEDSSPRPASAADLEPVRALLDAAGLPLAGVQHHLSTFQVLDAPDGTLAGVVGLERHGAAWLLRSLAVRPECRGRGYGRALLTAAVAEATDAEADVFLLPPTRRRSSPPAGFANFPARRLRRRCRRAPSSRAHVRTPRR